jgi:hypothetical protein
VDGTERTKTSAHIADTFLFLIGRDFTLVMRAEERLLKKTVFFLR